MFWTKLKNYFHTKSTCNVCLCNIQKLQNEEAYQFKTGDRIECGYAGYCTIQIPFYENGILKYVVIPDNPDRVTFISNGSSIRLIGHKYKNIDNCTVMAVF